MLEQLYPGFPADPPSNWDSEERFRQLLNDLDLTSSPGYPYMKEAPTIGKWLEADGIGGFSEQKIQRLWFDVKQVLFGTYNHYFRVFVKDEPHKISKIESGKWRLIIASSLPVQMVWRMCFSHQNDWLNDNPYNTPSSHGLVFCYGGWRRFKAHCRSKGLRYSRDISAWDINAPGWVFRSILRFRTKSGPFGWRRTCEWLYDDAYYHSVLLFSNGLVLRQLFPGFMKSGLFSTISDNSLSMVLMHCLACYRAGLNIGSVWATGDDVLQTHISDTYVDMLESLGCKVKEWEEGLVFMGTDFNNDPEPCYFSKHVVNYWCQEHYRQEALDSYLRLYAYSDKFDFWYRVSRVAGFTMRSRAYYQFWYSSPIARWLTNM